jgi:carboxyl-terminal processing protease
MFADLDMVVLCNRNTASAAEVFVATLRDYGLAKIVGETTFGKGIMQMTLPLSTFHPDYDGYIKMTSYAYVTQCGVTYHEIGIAPSEGLAVSLSKEAMQYNFYVLPQELDNQLQTAFAQFQ